MSPTRTSAGLAVSLACALLAPSWLAAPCAAQRTGGSFGSSGRSWGSSSRGSSSSSGSSYSHHSSSDYGGSSSHYGGSSSSGYGGSSPSSSHSGGSDYDSPSPAYQGPSPDEIWRREYRSAGEPPVTDRERAAVSPLVPIWAEYLGVVGILFALTFAPKGLWTLGVRVHRSVRERMRERARRRRREARVYLASISVGLDWTVRDELQRRLTELQSSLPIETSRQRAGAASAVVELLREHVSAACYARASALTCPASEGPGELARIGIDMRARFTYETRGQRALDDAPELAARADEGPGMLVVTLVIGSSSEPRELGDIVDRASLDALLAAFVPEGALDGLEVIWSPAEDADRMSSYELERLYPELARLSDATTVGTVRCTHCSAPRPRELERCPQCGASDAA